MGRTPPSEGDTRLEWATTDELVEELLNRCPSALVVLERRPSPDNPIPFTVSCAGCGPENLVRSIGLAEAAGSLMKKDLENQMLFGLIKGRRPEDEEEEGIGGVG